jgi:hypothetical protein
MLIFVLLNDSGSEAVLGRSHGGKLSAASLPPLRRGDETEPADLMPPECNDEALLGPFRYLAFWHDTPLFPFPFP